MTEAERQRDLEALQNAIYRDKVERARAMTGEERFADVFELTDGSGRGHQRTRPAYRPTAAGPRHRTDRRGTRPDGEDRMNIEKLAIMVVDACESSGADYMLTGAFAYGAHAIPRRTNDAVVAVPSSQTIDTIINRLDDKIAFGGQVQFDTLTWGKRHVGKVRGQSHYQVELFELFDDPFVMEQFERRWQLKSPQLGAD